MRYRIIVVDDEAEIAELLRLYLEKDGYQIATAENGAQAYAMIERESFDLAVVDIMMPEMDGFSLIKKIRGTLGSKMPIIALSARAGDSDKILGLELGADDYVTKPFNPHEVAARISASLRRFYGFPADGETKRSLSVEGLRLDLDACTAEIDGKTIELTSTEFRVLKLFMESPGRVFTKQQIFEAGWNEAFAVDDNSIMVCISKLRSKIGEERIKTIRGLGYRLERHG